MPDKPDFGTLGRYKELLTEMTPAQKEAFDFTMKERGQVPGRAVRKCALFTSAPPRSHKNRALELEAR
jgi:hypothetical protein